MARYFVSKAESVYLYPLWIMLERECLTLSYNQMVFPELKRKNRLKLVASPDGKGDSLTIQQDTQALPFNI